MIRPHPPSITQRIRIRLALLLLPTGVYTKRTSITISEIEVRA